jgi:hypothetical protein
LFVLQGWKRKDATHQESYVLHEDDGDDEHGAQTKKAAKPKSKTVLYSSSSSSSDECKEAENDMEICNDHMASSSSSSSSSEAEVGNAQRKVLEADDLLLHILCFLTAAQRIGVALVSKSFNRCGAYGTPSCPQIFADIRTVEKINPASVARLYSRCADLTLGLDAVAQNHAPSMDKWRRKFLFALTLDNVHSLSFISPLRGDDQFTWDIDNVRMLCNKTPRLTSLCIDASMDPSAVWLLLKGPRADKLHKIVITLSSTECARAFVKCVPKLRSVSKVHIKCRFSGDDTMSSVLDAVCLMPTLSMFVLQWRNRSLTVDHIVTLRSLLTKHHHTLRKIQIAAGSFLESEFSLWLLRWAGQSTSLVIFTANTFYSEECVEAATNTLTLLSGQLRRFHVCANYNKARLGPRAGVKIQVLLDFVAACRSASKLAEASIDEVYLPVGGIRNGSASSTLKLPDNDTNYLTMSEVTDLYIAFFDASPVIKRVTFGAMWSGDVAAEVALANLMHHLPAVQDLCGTPRIHNLAQIPSVLVAACVAHPTWATVSSGEDRKVVHTKEELADYGRPLTLRNTANHAWTICALASRPHPRIAIDTSLYIPSYAVLGELSSGVDRTISVDVGCTGLRVDNLRKVIGLVDYILLSEEDEFLWSDCGVPIEFMGFQPIEDGVVIRSSVTKITDYANIRRSMKHGQAVPLVLLVYDSGNQHQQAISSSDVAAFFSEWIRVCGNIDIRLCRLEVEGPASLLPPIGMYPLHDVCRAVYCGSIRTICVHGDQLTISPPPTKHVVGVHLQAKGAFLRQIGPVTVADAALLGYDGTHVDTFEVSVETMDELMACVWCVGQGNVTIFWLSPPGGSPEQVEETKQQCNAVFAPCLKDKASICFGGSIDVEQNADNGMIVCTITKPDTVVSYQSLRVESENEDEDDTGDDDDDDEEEKEDEENTRINAVIYQMYMADMGEVD